MSADVEIVREAVYMGDNGQPCMCSDSGKCLMHGNQERAEAALKRLEAVVEAALVVLRRFAGRNDLDWYEGLYRAVEAVNHPSLRALGSPDQGE
jgi:hypothetical protein